jgi:putative ABC transport system permease protein
MAEGLGGFGVDTVLFPTVRLSDYFIFVLFILLTSFLASIYPTRLIMKVPSP